MELPKNVTQIGEVSRDCKVYVEDYVISYLKQLNSIAMDKELAVALYGRRCEENGVAYLFLYGACKVNYLQREVRHLSQAQKQEIESLRKKYFSEHTFLGYRLLNGEMIEGFHICEQEICRYVPGYAQFYEKNDSMLAYMLAVREEAKPEQVDQGKYEEVKKRQEERRAATERPIRVKKAPSINFQRMRLAAVGAFALLCLVGIAALQEKARQEGLGDLQASAGEWLKEIRGKQLSDPPEDIVAASAEIDTLVMEDKLEQALLEENRQSQDASEETDQIQDALEEPDVSEEQDTTDKPDTQEASEPAEEALSEAVSEEVPEPELITYVIKSGDTLSGISVHQYGNDARVTEICALNGIADPDNIKEGQIIQLPR